MWFKNKKIAELEKGIEELKNKFLDLKRDQQTEQYILRDLVCRELARFSKLIVKKKSKKVKSKAKKSK